MTWLCQHHAQHSAARWQALQPVIWEAITRAMQAVSLLSAEDLLATGLLSQACQLLAMAGRSVAALAQQLTNEEQQQQQPQQGQSSDAVGTGPLAHKRRTRANGCSSAQQHTPAECMLQLLDMCHGQLLPVVQQVYNASSASEDQLAAVAALLPCLQLLLQAGNPVASTHTVHVHNF